jgi:hypothetical protein
VAASYRRVASLKTADAFQDYLLSLGIAGRLPFTDDSAGPGATPLGEPLHLPDGRTVGNRFCISRLSP